MAVVQVRIMGQPEEVEAFLAAQERAPGVQVIHTSGPRENRRDPGVRVHATVEVNPTVVATEMAESTVFAEGAAHLPSVEAIPLPPAR
ncbi:hypothetical protein [Nocardiopsis synnemataformans]|uniref:hypothetical protein n=1 Tax=Nocardiopsis synnemataformans TaxID=61305 RepID=UPI003EC066DF